MSENTYYKFCEHVFVAKCPRPYEKGDKVTLTTRRGKQNEHIIHNLVGKTAEHFFYSITRADGYNSQERAKNKAQKYKEWAESRRKKGEDRYEMSSKDAAFLGLGEPIKVGHHSEKRHRKAIDDAQENMRKFIEHQEKAKEHEAKAQYWADQMKKINLSMPESLEYYREKLAAAKLRHAGLKSGLIEREHSYSLTYARNDVKKLERKVELAETLWS